MLSKLSFESFLLNIVFSIELRRVSIVEEKCCLIAPDVIVEPIESGFACFILIKSQWADSVSSSYKCE